MRRNGLWAFASLWLMTSATLLKAESYTLEEPAAGGRVFDVSARMTLTGNLETSLGGGKSQSLPLTVEATHQFLERRLVGAGRDAEAFRSLREYRRADAAIVVDKNNTSTKLNDAHRRIVAQGRREGVVFYSPSTQITRADIGLLTMPGDSLAALTMLPRSAVEVGEKWSADTWTPQFVVGVDAVAKSDLNFEVESVSGGTVTVKFAGKVEGATLGAATEITFTGKYRYDVAGKHIRSMEFEQKEKRSVGAISPGMNVTAKVILERKPAADPGPLTDAVAEKIPLEPAVELLLLDYETPWNVRLVHDRDWHVYHDTAEAAVLRLLDKGSLIAQCNIQKLPPAAPGKHISEEKFQGDIQKVLGEQFKSFENAEQIKTDDGRFLYRVTVLGEGKADVGGEGAKPLPTQWIYYLCADASGSQCSMFFAVEPKLVEKLANRDLAMVKSLKFINREPTKAP